jgi:hypothetical protein
MLAIQLAAAIEAARPSQLEQLARTLWRGHAAGHLSPDEAQSLAEVIHERRARRAPSAFPARPHTSLFPPRPKSCVRLHPARVARRRGLAASAPLPPRLASQWTTGELAVLRILSDEAREKGVCDRSLAEIAARAGVCRSLAQATIRRAARLGLVTIEERRRMGARNLPNLVKIISPEWRTWLKRGPKHRASTDAPTGSRNSAPTEQNLFQRPEKQVRFDPRPGSGRSESVLDCRRYGMKVRCWHLHEAVAI